MAARAQARTAEEAARDRYPRPVVSTAEAEWIWRQLSVQAMEDGAKPETVRLAVVVGLARASGARYGGLLRCTLSALDLDSGWVTIEHGKHRVPRRHGLDRGTVLVLRRWLRVRQELCAELEGSVPDALLLTVHHTHDNGVTVAAGLPITRQGLVLSWRRFVHRTNARHAARRPPLPTRFEQVRRVWDA
ncbi:tyrosine-type recombinase/integrase [Streptomyces samsunensis]|uniref:tyrosine-type recombinase/integrase n=1 Tax=Streptomyces malaysiensis TaxID=92644 RepID=UPI000C2C4F0F|nr:MULTISPECIES: tyrosine-type recombinase/integrase [Streptomyces]AUA09266.1 Phage integrase family protein [Streptomyces sp. M56]MCQ6245756.1 site-specific integrase [Streptomyces malaysiensis]MYX55017.1 tyrosine-type recombinase/integrase [Streptomyces sp. SID8382]NUH37899.1 tyrosine-type recombinase/integrase [Streptomyces samsunensis]